jgi:hypothetical protein
MMYRNKFIIVCFTISVSVSILTELKSSWPVILTGDLTPVILSSAGLQSRDLNHENDAL